MECRSKMHIQRNFMCSCLVKGDMWSSCDTFYGLKPEIYLSLHLSGKQSRKILVRRSWIRSCCRMPPPPLFGSRMVESWLPIQPLVSGQARGEGKIVNSFKSNSLVSEQFLSDLEFEDRYGSKDITNAIKKGSDCSGTFRRSDQPVEEPWLLQSSLLSHSIRQSDSSSELMDKDKGLDFLGGNLPEHPLNQSTLDPVSRFKSDATVSAPNNESIQVHTTLSEDYPVEEPWLFQPSSLVSSSDCAVNTDVSKSKELVEIEAENLEANDHNLQVSDKVYLDEDSMECSRSEAADLEPCDQLQEVPEKLFIDEESRVALQESVSTVILINSSLCTMQRIAVLEDEKLVELLLEPVKNNVQSDSVYLGVVTKLVPNMGGAFVNIGCSRPSLMDIKHNREPFIFPPFRLRRNQREVNGSSLGALLDHPGANENDLHSNDAEANDDVEEHDVIDDSVQYMHDDFGEHEIEDDFDASEVLNENANGSAVGSAADIDAERHLDQLVGDLHESQPQTFSDLLFNMGCSDGPQHSHLEDIKDCKEAGARESKWARVQKSTKIVVQVVKEGLGTKGPTLTAYPKLRSRFWILITRCNSIGISKKISGVERTRLRVIAKTLQPRGFGLTVRTVATGHSLEELQKDLEGLLSTWKDITEHAKSAALAADEGVEGAIPVMLHRAMGQTLSVVQDYFNDKVKSMVVDSPRTYHEITNYLQEIAPDLCGRVELYSKKTPIFDEYKIEEELNNMLSKRVPLSNGGYLVIEQTEALVSIDVNGGQCMLGQGTSQEKAILDVNLAAAKRIARELRLRDIGGIIVVDFIDMLDDSNKRLVYEEVKKAVERDRSMVKVSELSRHGLMEITRKRVRPSVTFMISEPCPCCQATGRVEALETSFSKIEREICRLLALMNKKPDPGNPKLWPKFILRVDRYMCNYLTSGKRTRLAVLSSSLKVWILLKVARGFTRGAYELKPLTDDKDFNNQNQVAISVLRRTDVGNTPSGKVTIFPIKKWKTGSK